MQNVALRGLPDDLHEWLKREAERSSRSLNGQISHLLQEAYAKGQRCEAREARLDAFRATYLSETILDLDDVIGMIREERDGR